MATPFVVIQQRKRKEAAAAEEAQEAQEAQLNDDGLGTGGTAEAEGDGDEMLFLTTFHPLILESLCRKQTTQILAQTHSLSFDAFCFCKISILQCLCFQL